MTSTLIGESARPLVERDYESIAPAELPLWERAQALKVLGRESDSWTRVAAGLAAWVGGVASAAALVTVISNDAQLWLRLVCLVVGVALALGSWRLGRRVWQAGRRVVDAFCWWTLLPERMPEGGAGVEGWRDSPARDATAARVFVFDGLRVVRIVLAALSAFAPLLFLDSLDRGPRFGFYDGEGLALTLFSLALLAIGLGTAAVLLWGQYRAAKAHAERDPIQRWILRRDR